MKRRRGSEPLWVDEVVLGLLNDLGLGVVVAFGDRSDLRHENENDFLKRELIVTRNRNEPRGGLAQRHRTTTRLRLDKAPPLDL